jgi:hypothetical protein
MRIDQKILNELSRYKQINNYIMEQDVPPPPPPAGDLPPVGGATPPPAGDTGAMLPPPPTAPSTTDVPATPVDTETDPDVEKVEDENSKKIEVTDLVKSQKSVEEKQDEYFENLFNHLNDLESKLSAMDNIIDKLNNIETKIEKYRIKTPEEKLELRTLDSGPFNQKLSQFFEDKETEMEMTGKNEYVLTPDEVESYSPNEIKRSFRNFGEDEMTPEDDMSKFKKIY